MDAEFYKAQIRATLILGPIVDMESEILKLLAMAFREGTLAGQKLSIEQFDKAMSKAIGATK